MRDICRINFFYWVPYLNITLQAPIPQNGQTHSNNSSLIYWFNIVRTPSLPFSKRGSKFWLPPWEGGIWKIKKSKKRGWKYGAGASLLKRGGGGGRGGWHFSYLNFSKFIIFRFTLCKRGNKYSKKKGGGASWVKGWVLYKGGLEPPYELCSTNWSGKCRLDRSLWDKM